ncbi:hypothetical protein [Acetatifactor muris]|uniref:hypothetical protein n=1 Tax=Acetatifactor muris TaxID=879566 RepID=UPI0023F2C9DE|nr:hypothetical protein [Acetatifactor muris]
MEHKQYRVKFQDDGGKVIFREFDTMEQAQDLYNSLDEKAEIQKFNEDLGHYEIVVYPTFEY